MSLEDIYNEEKAYAEKQSQNFASEQRAKASERIAQVDYAYDQSLQSAKASYDAAVRTATQNYRTAYDRNAANYFGQTRWFGESMANMGLTNSGLHTVRRKSAARARKRADHRVSQHKQDTLRKFKQGFNALQADFETAREADKETIRTDTENRITQKTQEYEQEAVNKTLERQAKSVADIPEIKFNTPKSSDIGMSYADVRFNTARLLHSGDPNAMTSAWKYLEGLREKKIIGTVQMSELTRELGILSPSQQEYYTDRAGNFRYQLPASAETLRQTAKTERASEIPQSSVNEDFVNTFFKDYNAFVSDARAAVETIGYDNAATLSSEYDRRGLDLQKRAVAIEQLFRENREIFGEETFQKYMGYLEDVVSCQKVVRDHLQSLADNIAAFDSKEAYETAFEYATYDLDETAGAFLQKTDIVSRQIDRDTLYEKLVKETADDLRTQYTSKGFVGTSHLDYEEIARKQIDAELKHMAELDPNSDDYRIVSGSDLYRLAEYDRVNNEALTRLGYHDYATFKADYDKEEHTRKVVAYNQKGMVLYEDATSAADFGEKSRYDHKIRDVAYRFINGEGLSAKAMENLPAVLKNIRQYMSAEEIAVYNYYYVTKGKDAADKYLRVIEDALTSRKANELFAELDKGWLDGVEFKDVPALNNMLDVVKDAVNEREKFRFGVLTGLDQFAGGIKNAVSGREDYIPASAVQKASAQVSADLYGDGGLDGTLKRLGYNTITAAANMAPSILASVAVTKLTGSAKAGQMVGSALMGLSAKGNAYVEAINSGYTKEQAQLYSTLIGASEVGLQTVLGGIGKLGGNATAKVLKAVDSVDKALFRVPLKLGAKIAAEGSEEWLQEVLNPVFTYIATGEHTDVDWGAAAEAFVIGGLTAGMFETGSTVSTDSDTRRVGTAILDNSNVQGLKDLASMMPKDSEAYRLSQSVDEQSGAYHVGKLYAAICDAMNVGKTNAKTKPQTTEQSQNPTVGGDAHIAPQNTDTKTSESDYAEIIANAEATLTDVGDGSPVPTQSANFSSPTVEELTEIFKNGMKRAGYVPSQTPAPTTTPIDHKTDTSSPATKTATSEPTVKELTKLFIDGATRSGYVPAETTATTVDESQADSSKDDIDTQKRQEYNSVGTYGAKSEKHKLGSSKTHSPWYEHRKRQLQENKKQGDTYENKIGFLFKLTHLHAQKQITIKTASGKRVRVDFIGYDLFTGKIVIEEVKSSSTARFTKNQIEGFPSLIEEGGVVVGKGKGRFAGGTVIPPQTDIYVRRPNEYKRYEYKTHNGA